MGSEKKIFKGSKNGKNGASEHVYNKLGLGCNKKKNYISNTIIEV